LLLEQLEDRCVPAVSITEFSSGISPGANPYGIVTGPDGNLWFTEFAANQIARLNPTTGAVTEYGGLSPASGPQDITVGPDGNLWFTEYTANQVGRINPTTGLVTEFSAGITPGSRPFSITTGPDGNLWFTESAANQIACITTNGFVTEYGYGLTSGSGPFDITKGPDGNLWFTENSANQIGRLTPSTGAITEYGGLASGASPQGIAAGPDGSLWFTENGANEIGRITTSGTVNEYTNGISAGSGPRDITGGPDANLWFTEGAGDRVASITTGGTVNEYTNGISVGSTPQDITMGPDGNLWFTEFNSPPGNNRIARVQGIAGATTVTLTTSNGAPVYGETVFFTATVGAAMSGISAPTSGVVVFRDNGRIIGASAIAGGIAVLSTDTLPAGSHQITASFTATGNYSGSTSATVSEQVTPAPTSISVTSSGSPSLAGQMVTYIATVTNTDTNSGVTPTGYVTFSDNGTVIGSTTLSGGLAVVSSTPTVAGNHTISAVYTPSPNFQATNTDGPWTQQVTGLTATQLVFLQQPTFALAGTAFNPPVMVSFADQYGNPVGGAGNVTLTMASNPYGAALAGATTQFVNNGMATFVNVYVTRPGTNLTLVATSSGLTSATSAPFTIASTTHFGVAAPASVGANANMNLTVVALTAANAQDTLYQGTVTIIATLGASTITLVPSYTFTTLDRGRHIFTGLQLPSAGRWTITVTDTHKPTVLGKAVISVTAPAVVHKTTLPTPSPGVMHTADVFFMPLYPFNGWFVRP
jgi:streptogramin lyase